MTPEGRHISIIVAVARNGVIGRERDLPWRLSDDLKWFKKTTMGKPIIMGRTTYDSIGKPLPGRANIVVTRQEGWSPEGVEVAHSIEEALDLADSAAKDAQADEICIIGGAHLYAQTMEMADRLYVTLVQADVEGDKTFDLPPREEWRVTPLATIIASERNDHDAVIERWERKSNPSCLV